MSKYDVIIVGAGIAGCTAAIYARRAELNVLLIEKEAIGGKLNIIDKIENYPGFESVSGFELVTHLQKQLELLRTDILYGEVESIRSDNEDIFVKVGDSEFIARSVVVTTGSVPKGLGIGEEKYIGRGVSYCAICDAPFFKNKTIALVGGGNSAVQEAIYLSKFVNKIYLIHRRSELRAEQYLLKKLSKLECIEYVLEASVKGIYGNKKVEYIDVTTKDGLKKLEVEGLFIFIGYSPNTSFLSPELKNEYGEVFINDHYSTSIKGIWAAGDLVIKSPHQLAAAVGDACRAIINVSEYLRR